MKQEELEKKIKELERRIQILESRTANGEVFPLPCLQKVMNLEGR